VVSGYGKIVRKVISSRIFRPAKSTFKNHRRQRKTKFRSDGAEVVAVDEAQFLDMEIIEVCNTLANQGIRVIVAGLDMDFTGKPFGPMPYLMAVAEYVTKVHAICTRTGNLAHYSFRKSETETQIVVGEKDIYEPLSRGAFLKLREQ